LRRSRELVSRARGTVILITILQFFIPILAFKMGESIKSFGFVKASGSPSSIFVFKILANLLVLSPSVLMSPLVAIMLVLLYFNTRLSGGETINEATLIEDDLPQSKWQQRLQERLRLRTGGFTKSL
jgi:hypothetical protein